MPISKPHILVIARTLPFPLDRGERVRLNGFFQAFRVFAEITWVSAGSSDSDQSSIEHLNREYPETNFIRLKNKPTVLPFMHRMLRPNLVTSQCNKENINEVSDIIRKNSISHVFLKGIQYVPYVEKLLRMKNRNLKLIFDLDDIESKKHLRYIQTLSFGKGRFYISSLIDYIKLYFYEKSFLRYFDMVVVASPLDSDSLKKKLGLNNIRVVKNSLSFPPISYEKTNNNIILFIGSLGYDPNYDAVMFFLKEIFPRIKKEEPEVRFYVAGPDSGEFLQTLHDGKSIFILGFISDLSELYRNASIVVVPLRIGGGTRVKIIEAAAYYKPIVSTSIGNEGLDFKDCKDIIIANTPEKFAKACLDLLKNENQRRLLAQNARDTAESNYSYDKVRNSIIDLVNY